MMDDSPDEAWTLTNEDARAWAAQYAGVLVQGITTTSATLVQGGLSDFIAGRLTYTELTDLLAPTFGEQRADLISTTEITRSFAMGANLAAARNGFWLEFNCANDERVCQRCGSMAGQIVAAGSDAIPQHARCRCWWSMSVDGPDPNG